MGRRMGVDLSDIIIVGTVTLATGLFLYLRSGRGKAAVSQAGSAVPSRDERSREPTFSAKSEHTSPIPQPKSMFASIVNKLTSTFSSPSSTPPPSSPNFPRPPEKRASKKTISTTLASMESEHKMILFYGSQTGTAEDLATRTANEVYANFGVESVVADLEDYDMSDLVKFTESLEGAGKVVVGFFLATYGEGEPTDNAADFYEWFMDGRGKVWKSKADMTPVIVECAHAAQRKAKMDAHGARKEAYESGGECEDEDVHEIGDEIESEQQGAGIHYIVFGLGNKTYEHFNSMGKRIDKRLTAIGAKRVGPAGEGDDDGSMEEDFLAWKPKVLESLSAFYGVKDMGGKAGRGLAHIPLFNLAQEDELPEKSVFHGELASDHKPRRFKDGPGGDDKREFVEVSTKKRILYDAKNPLFSPVIASRNLFNVTHDELKLNPTDIIPASPSYTHDATAKSLRIPRECIHMEFSLASSGLRYETGDHVGIYGANPPSAVAALARALRLTDKDLEGIVRLKANPANRQSAMAKTPFPNPCTVRVALTHYLAITTPVKQHQLEVLAKYAGDEGQRARVYEIVDDRALFVEAVDTPQKTLAEVLEDFPSIQIPLQVVLGELLPPIVVRYYSISSSSKKEPTIVSITAVGVRYALPAKPLQPNTSAKATIRYKEGLVTSYVSRLHHKTSGLPVTQRAADETYPHPHLTTHVPLFIRTSSFRLPRDSSAPIIMIGPGTGVAPFRGFVAERVNLAAAAGGPKKPIGSTWLFYGCRHPEQDHLYKEEFAEYEAVVKGWRESALEEERGRAFDLRIETAYSRVPGKQKVYVQDLVQRRGAEVFEVLDKLRG
ncbi:hypothetical protein BC830DRAFT_1234213 [Chytriomyces sp. MP71]|nr:hypothetical protein BC830DRAFT_1234213 [Chytriomyces sp. MP71]